MSDTNIPGWKDKILFTPGPLTTSHRVKEAMLRDFGSRDYAFIQTVKDMRQMLLEIAGVEKGDYEAIPMQGSGTFALESVLSSTVPADGKVLVAINGAYGKRLRHMADILKIPTVAVECAENQAVDPAAVEAALQADDSITHVVIVHCETTTGIINPIEAVGALAKKHNCVYFVDAMSSFGAVPIDFQACRIDYLVSSANKCIEGVPGFAFAIAKHDTLLQTEGYARSLSLDLLSQWKGLEKNGQFRFTPPTHAIVAFHRALLELRQEGGVAGRASRYRENYNTLVEGMRKMGFKEYLPPPEQGYIITSFLFPDHPKFDFETFYEKLNQRDQVIYPGKVSNADCFRIGNIGRIFPRDVQGLLATIREVIEEMGVEL